MQTENSSYFVASRHKLSAFFSLIFRFSSCHHPLIAYALAKIVDDHDNRTAIGKDENAVRQLISMISSENRHVVSEIFSRLIYSVSINPIFMFRGNILCLVVLFSWSWKFYLEPHHLVSQTVQTV